MKIKVIVTIHLLFVLGTFAAYNPLVIPRFEAAAETRCGWFINPTPANAWLIDAKGEWIIGTQGGSQADGDWPSFGKSQWIKTNGSYGYGCACMKVTTDAADMKVLSILSSTTKPLSACRKDKSLKGKEPRGA